MRPDGVVRMTDGSVQTYAGALERSLLEAGYLSGEAAARYAASIKLARSLAAKMDDLERNEWLNAIGKPDTATAGQYLRALEALGLTPPKRATGGAAKSDEGRGADRRGSVASFREKHLKVV